MPEKLVRTFCNKPISEGSTIYHCIPSYGIIVKRKVLKITKVGKQYVLQVQNVAPGFRNTKTIHVVRNKLGYELISYAPKKKCGYGYIYTNEKLCVNDHVLAGDLRAISPAKMGVSKTHQKILY